MMVTTKVKTGVITRRSIGVLSTSRYLTLRLLFILNFSLIIITCGLDVEDPSPPSPPIWVQKSLPQEWPERGIDAHESGGIYLEWVPNSENDIMAYHLYRAMHLNLNDSTSDFEKIQILDVDDGFTCKYVDVQLERRKSYIYKLKSENGSGALSESSQSVTYTLLPAPNSNDMVPNGLAIELHQNAPLSWICVIGVEVEDYIITILTENDDLVIRLQIIPGNYTGSREYWRAPPELPLIVNQVYKWRIDYGAHYVNGLDLSGSESAWARFLFVGP